ncbi:Carboxylesterase [Ancylostoma ceylanicum]|uniref:Carboxylic ester hydrolase n=1 Tax=Ancylostoma ceylanicum TaxID=53326 RepID=A0A0D6M2D5_9BILA|nr:Carboxylesterase [Ancylostoma ceylanicum]
MGSIVSFLNFRKTDTTRASRQVRTRYGIVEGFRLDIGSGKDVDLFLGIPFAAPPVGELRFKKPQPPEKWEDVRKCVSFGPRAPQSDFFWERITLGRKSEDCLYLNVFTPAWKADDEEAGHTVMVYVHGGGYLIDSAVKYGDKGIAKYLCRHDVIVVTIQYRLGLLGFFSTGDAVCDGNLGLWDMTMALQWVQDNIRAFGGNPNKVTVFGQSAGGASVDMLALSPHSRDSLSLAENLLDAVDGKDPVTGMDVSKIGLDLAPIVGTSPEDFLPKGIDELRAEAPRKKCLVGTCQHEGLLFATLSPSHFNIRGLDKLLSVVITPENHVNYEDLRRQARELYLSDVNLANKVEVARAYVKLYSDLFVNNGTYNYVKKMTELGNRVYLYSFEFFNPQSFGILSIRMPFKGATHCTELTYLFGVSIVFGFQFSEADNKMIDLMTRNPNGPYEDSTVFDFMWEPTTKENFSRYLRINEKCEMRSNYEDRRAEFWKNIRITSKGT